MPRHRRHVLRLSGGARLAAVLSWLAIFIACHDQGDLEDRNGNEPPTVMDSNTSSIAADHGLIVEYVLPGRGAARAGMKVGDRLQSWRFEHRIDQEIDGRDLVSELDFARLREHQRPRGRVTLIGSRAGEPRTWTLPEGDQGVEVRPALPSPLQSRYLEIAEARWHEDPEPKLEAAKMLDALANEALEADPLIASFLFGRAADLRHRSGQWSAAVESYTEAAEAAEAAGRSWEQGQYLYYKANSLSRRFDDATSAYEILERVEALWSEAGEESLATASVLTLRGEIARRQGDLPRAASNLRRALEIKRRLAPESLSTARTLSILGKVEATRGAFDIAEGLLAEAHELRRRLDAGDQAVAHSLSALGTLRLMRGDLAGAEQDLRESLRLFERVDETSDNVVVMLSNLGTLASLRGDLLSAERSYERALALAELQGGESLNSASVLHHLAGMANRRGNVKRATRLGLKALEIRQRSAPDSLDVAFSLNQLANIENTKGELAQAARYLEQALEIQEILAPNSLDVARGVHNLARVDLERGELEAARRRLLRAESLMRAVGPITYDLGRLWTSLGDLESRSGFPAQAEKKYRQAIEHLKRLAPGSVHDVEAHWGLAKLLDDEGRTDEALEIYRRAEAALDLQQGRLGGGQEAQSRFRARFRELNRRRIELELKAGTIEAAFEALENARARVFLTLLSERDLVFADIPAELDAERRRAATRVDRALNRLLEAPPEHGNDEVQKSLEELEEARRQLRLTREEVRSAAPNFSLTAPQKLRDGSSLDPGTLALVYAVGPESGTLFLVAHGAPIKTRRLGIGEHELAGLVERFRLLMRSHGLASTRSELSTLSRRLHRLLIDPAAKEVADAARLLIVPDGPLHLLPFAALEADGEGPERYLGIAHPLHAATSLGVYGQIKERGQHDGPAVGARSAARVAFADPGPRSRPAATVRGGTGFSPLPASRGEAWAIKRRFPETRLFLGRQATESRARETLATASVVHFAVHGFLDERYPLSSGLVLAKGGDGNGLLQAWEIFEGVRTEADLVTLSGCETAIGEEIDGEGLLGLTRAFQWAGARSVLASLWRVSDRGTAALMDRLYHHLAEGLPISSALQQARADLAQDKIAPPDEPAGLLERIGRELGWVAEPEPEDFSHPIYWSGFRLDGDWR